MVDPLEDSYRERLYDAYVSTHAGLDPGGAIGFIYKRDIQPHLPPEPSARILDIGCGQGELVRQLSLDGYRNVAGVDVSREQVAAAHSEGNTSVELGDFVQVLESQTGEYHAILAIDLLEHLSKPEVFRTFDRVFDALTGGGVFIARVPNAVGPFGGNYRHGDFTHETSFTARSLAQLARAAGFDRVSFLASRPLAHGIKSGLRSVVWRGFEAIYKLALAAETGQTQGHIVTQNLVMVALKEAPARKQK